jgi:hypothetical protein
MNAVVALAGLEARRYLRSPTLLIGCALTTFLWFNMEIDHEEWVGSGLQQVATAAFPLYIGAFVAAALIGMRDNISASTPIATTTPLTTGECTTARLIAGVVPVSLATICVGAMLVYVKANDGIVFDATRRMPPIAELILIPALVGLAVASAIAAGQLVRSRVAVTLGGGLVVFVTTAVYWIFGNGAVRFLVPPVVNPREVKLPLTFTPADAPDHWIVTAPDEYTRHWHRVVFDTGSTWWHLVYIVGLAALLGAIARRVHGPSRPAAWLMSGGCLAAVAGGVLQLVTRTGAPL